MIFVAPFKPALAAIAAAIAADTDWIGNANAEMRLMKNNPAIDSNTVIASFTEADFGGYAAAVQAEGPAVLIDPSNGGTVLREVTVAEGYLFKVTSTTNLPQTIYGCYIVNDGHSKLLGAVKFDTPIILTAVDQYIDLGEVRWQVSPLPLGG